MRKCSIAAILVVSLMLLSGCGGEMTLEDKIADVQKKGEVSIEDVLTLMELEGLEYEIVEPSEDFRVNWPDVTICEVGSAHYFLLGSFAVGEERTALKSDCGWWRMAPLSESAKNAPFILDRLEQDFALENIDVVHVAYLDGKNIAGQLIPVIRQDMTDAEWDAVNKENKEVYSTLERIFVQYINGNVAE